MTRFQMRTRQAIKEPIDRFLGDNQIGHAAEAERLTREASLEVMLDIRDLLVAQHQMLRDQYGEQVFPKIEWREK